ncbi:hypothetical protein H0W91_00030 [Patescibacteria group bacterium]|nr:hypothetical protein [Patescibacteria group bacterium]
MYTISCNLRGCDPDEYGLFKTQKGARNALKRRGWVRDKNAPTINHFKLRLVYFSGVMVYLAVVVPYGPYNLKNLPHKKSRLGFRGGKTVGPIK